MEKEIQADKSIEKANDETFCHLDILHLSDKKSIIEVLKVGTIHDRGLKITEDMLGDFVKNFNDGVYGSEVQVNLGHQRDGEAAGWITKLIKEGQRLLAEVEWTPLGIEKIQSKQYKFTSSELALSYPDAKTGKKVNNVFIGVALTNVPAVKGMAPVSLSEEANLFLNSNNTMDKVKKMHAKLMAQKSVSKEEMDEFKEACKDHADDKEATGMMKELADKVAPPKEEKKVVEKASDDTKETVSLAEVTKLQEQLAQEKTERIALQEKIERKELSEKIEKDFTPTKDHSVGFVGGEEDKAKLTNFLMSLSQEQRSEFFELMAKVQHVDLSVRGSSTDAMAKKDGEVLAAEEKATAMAKDTGKPYHECLSEIYRVLDEAKK